jgi:putative PIN family toxin of toxin-antitoxin system
LPRSWPESGPSAVKLVLDTNVVIDWLVFDDEFLASFRERVRARAIQVITHTPAVHELRRVLGYPILKLSAERQATVLEQYLALASFADSEPKLAVAAAPAELPAGFPRCRDSDDDPFLWLAWRAGADALVSRDKAVLKLAKRARKFGFQIYDVPKMIEVLGTAPSVTMSSTQLSSVS